MKLIIQATLARFWKLQKIFDDDSIFYKFQRVLQIFTPEYYVVLHSFIFIVTQKQNLLKKTPTWIMLNSAIRYWSIYLHMKLYCVPEILTQAQQKYIGVQKWNRTHDSTRFKWIF